MVRTTTTRFICQQCGAAQTKWSGRCATCGEWNSLIEEAGSNLSVKSGKKLEPVNISNIPKIKTGSRLDTGISEVNRVLGGGLVAASVMLLAGEPGIGKSTLLLQLACELAKKQAVLYVSGEESVQQIKLRADRLKVSANELQLLAATNTDDIAATIMSDNYALVIIDSIQTMATDQLTAGAGSVSQITASAQHFQKVAKATGSSILMVGHVTKEGNIAGPKVLEHLVDVVLYLEGERFGAFKMLRGVKNRFGSTNEVGIFEMQDAGMVAIANPSLALLSERQTSSDGTVVFATVEGSRALLVEVQALVSTSSFGYPKRTSVGFDLNRMNILLAVLAKRANMDLSAYDVYVNVVGGLKLNEPAADLAVAMAIASARKGKQIISSAVIFGEVGLNGEVRSVPQVEKRLQEAVKVGFKTAIVPSQTKSKNSSIKVDSMRTAIEKGLL
jgi:DNA repair protein RadA/Sms